MSGNILVVLLGMAATIVSFNGRGVTPERGLWNHGVVSLDVVCKLRYAQQGSVYAWVLEFLGVVSLV